MANLYFAHANGFSAKTYAYLFELLEPHKVTYIENIGHGDYEINQNWTNLANELIADIESKHQQAVVGVGHSLGAVITLFAALKRPDLFSQIIILDPPILRPIVRLGIYVGGLLNLTDRYFVPAKKAKHRKQHFENREEAYQYFKSKALFLPFEERSLRDYVKYGLKKCENSEKLTLTFEAEKEYQVFCTTPYRLPKGDLKIPATLVYSPKKEVLQPKDVAFLSKKFKWQNIIAFDGVHLFPMQKPQETADLIKKIVTV
ncbi:MAG: alpha/beta hydrolase [Chitinophagales bacterium]